MNNNIYKYTDNPLDKYIVPKLFSLQNQINNINLTTPDPTLTDNFMVGLGMDSSGLAFAYTYDGQTWFSSPSGKDVFNNGGDERGKAVAWNGSIWVAVSDQHNGTNPNSTIAYSSDGINWTAVPFDPFGGYATNGIAWNGSIWIAVGTNAGGGFGSTSAATSPDGINWTSCTGPFPGGQSNCIASNGSLWVAGGLGIGGNKIASSSDGLNWTSSTSPIFQGGQCYTVAWNGSIWVAGGNGGGINSTSQLVYSTNGTDWTTADSPSDIFGGGQCNSVAWNGSLWLAGGSDEGGNRIYYSVNGKDWTSSRDTYGNANLIFTNECLSVSWNGTYLIAGGDGTNQVAYSTDGKNWTGSTSGNSIFTINCVALASRRVLSYINSNFDDVSINNLTVKGNIVYTGSPVSLLADRSSSFAEFAPGATNDFINFSGLIIVTSNNSIASNNGIMMVVCGGHSVSIFFAKAGALPGGLNCITYAPDINGYRWTNNSVNPINSTPIPMYVTFAVIKTSNNG
jgi:hypothetical protein